MARPRAAKPFGFNVIGYVSGDLGLGVAARNTIDALLRRGEPVSAVDLVPPQGPGSERWFEHLQGGRGGEAPYAINLFQLTPPEIARLAHSAPLWLDMTGGFNICVPFWELPRFPPPWIHTLRAMDLVLAPSRFIEEAARPDLPSLPTIHYPQSVQLPQGTAADRARWGLAEDALVFLVSFDANSDTERKNPWAAIEGFRRAFGEMPGAVLLVKVLSRGAERSAAVHLARLESVVSSIDGVTVLRGELSYADTMNLYASADVIVSTHRSEGLGLVLMEAMSLGKVVITTGWSGNMDFTTEENSLLLEPQLVPVRGSQTQYSRLYAGRRLRWADVDVDEIAQHMITLAHDAQLRTRLGDRARLDMEERRSQAAGAGFVDAVRPHYREFLARGAIGGRSPLARRMTLATLPAGHAAYRLAADTHARLRSRTRPSASPLVSILTPSFNQAPWLAENLHSVRTQTYSPIEHIVMDGGSTDGSVELLRQAEGTIQWTSEPDRGQSHALNKALQESRGEIIGWLNSDDAYYDRGVVQAVVDFFASHPEVDVVYGHGAYVNADGKVLLMIYVPPFSHELLRRYCFVLQPSLFLRRRVLEREFVNESYQFAMDWELWLRLAHEGRRFARLDRVLAIDRLQPERKTVTLRDVYDADTKRLALEYGLPTATWLPPAVRALYVLFRLAGAPLAIRPRPELAFEGIFDSRLRTLRRQVASRRTRFPMGAGS